MVPSAATTEFVSITSPRVREIRDCDQLQFRRRGLISIAGRGEHSHSAKAIWWDGDLMCVEVREWVGGRAVTLESQVAKFPGKIDVFEANPHDTRDYNRSGAASYMRRLAGKPYGYWHIVLAALAHLPFVRLLTYVPMDDDDLPTTPPFCSEACAAADQFGGGVDPVPNLSNRMTEPADLSRSLFYRYKFTLVP